MPIATSPSALPRPATFVKMEDRKRPAASAVDDVAPPSKRQQVNGSSKSKDDSGDAKEEAWIEVSLVVTRQPCVRKEASRSLLLACSPPGLFASLSPIVNQHILLVLIEVAPISKALLRDSLSSGRLFFARGYRLDHC